MRQESATPLRLARRVSTPEAAERLQRELRWQTKYDAIDRIARVMTDAEIDHLVARLHVNKQAGGTGG